MTVNSKLNATLDLVRMLNYGVRLENREMPMMPASQLVEWSLVVLKSARSRSSTVASKSRNRKFLRGIYVCNNGERGVRHHRQVCCIPVQSSGLLFGNCC